MTNPSNSGEQPPELDELPFMSHLIELRDRVMRMVLAVLVVFVVLTPFANKLYSLLSDPLTKHLPEGSSMIAIQVASPFLIPFKLTLFLAVFIAIPVILHQAWAFIAPGLYLHERKRVIPLLISSTLLFYLGAAFAYFVVFPVVFAFLSGTTPEGVAMMTDIGEYLDFVLALFFAFGVAFEVPIATILLVWSGVVTPDTLRAKRPFVIVGAFVLGMLLTPPDIISQTLLALPMWLLFEAGIFFSEHFVKPKDQAEDDEDAYHPLSEDEMEAELDRMETEDPASDGSGGPVDKP